VTSDAAADRRQRRRFPNGIERSLRGKSMKRCAAAALFRALARRPSDLARHAADTLRSALDAVVEADALAFAEAERRPTTPEG
jgi:hypothetical protein